MNNEKNVRSCAVYMSRTINDTLQLLEMQQQQGRFELIHSSTQIEKHSKCIIRFLHINFSSQHYLSFWGCCSQCTDEGPHQKYSKKPKNRHIWNI
jgi:hypothetical protein